jgi:hypothetical protein
VADAEQLHALHQLQHLLFVPPLVRAPLLLLRPVRVELNSRCRLRSGRLLLRRDLLGCMSASKKDSGHEHSALQICKDHKDGLADKLVYARGNNCQMSAAHQHCRKVIDFSDHRTPGLTQVDGVLLSAYLQLTMLPDHATNSSISRSHTHRA